VNEFLELLKKLKLISGRGKPKSLLQMCHSGKLFGGISISLQALPDEVLGPLTALLSGNATHLRIEDSFGTRPMRVDIRYQDTTEKWELEDVSALIHNLNDFFKADEDVKILAILGEWEDMLQVWALTKTHMRQLLVNRVFEAANIPSLRTCLSSSD